jgi:Zn-dependent protease
MNLSSYLENIYIIPILIFSVVIHEMAHAWVALRCGDTTAKDLGRITLNPLPHIDLVGSILVPLFSILATGRVLIAWAKPVPIDPGNFRNFKRDDTLVTIAGPLSNFLIAFVCVWGVIGFFYLNNSIKPTGMGHDFISYMIKMFYAGIFLNVTLAVFNMIPIPPLDGSHVLANVMPDHAAMKFRSIGFTGIFIILMLFNFVPGFSRVFFEIINYAATPYLNLLDYFIK